MSHPEVDVLLALARGDEVGVGADDREHVASCTECGHEMTAVRRVLTAAGAGPEPLEQPAPALWERVAAGAGHDLHDRRRDLPVDPDADAPPVGRRVVALLAAAAVGAVLGGTATWALLRDDPAPDRAGEPDPTAAVRPVDGGGTAGTMALHEDDGVRRLTLRLDRVDAGDGYVEVWLLDPRTQDMVALGVLDGDRGAFAVPAGLDLAAYTTLDVSREPFDGDPAHAAASLARGELPRSP